LPEETEQASAKDIQTVGRLICDVSWSVRRSVQPQSTAADQVVTSVSPNIAQLSLRRSVALVYLPVNIAVSRKYHEGPSPKVLSLANEGGATADGRGI